MNKNIKGLLLIFVILTLFLLTYSSKPSNTVANASVKDDLSTFFHSLKSGNLNVASEYLDKSNKNYNSNLTFPSSFQEDMIKKSFSKIDYRILSTSLSEDSARVTLEITSLDLFSVYNDLMSKSLSPLIDKYLNGNEQDKIAAKNEAKKNISASITNIIKSDNFPRTTNKVKIALYKANGKWLIKPNKDFIYAITGRMPQFLNQFKTNK